jgi:gamma-glutamylputrescine oxidase
MVFPPQLSFWEIKQYFKDVDLLVIGSGIVGLTSAIFYKKKHPTAKVCVLEKGMLPSGASTKNAGFACFGSPSEILSDLKTSSEDEVYNLIKERLNGLNTLRNLVGDKKLDYEPCGGFEVFTKNDEVLFEKCKSFISIANKELKDRIDLNDTYSLADNHISEYGFSSIEHLIFNKYEGALDTGKMMAHLIKLAGQLDITILNGLEVSEFKEINSGVEVNLKNKITLKCRKLHIATNGFASSLLPNLDVKPARAQVLITSPIENLKVKGTFHMNEGYYYFRNVGNRILFGGGRQLDIAGETDTDLRTTERIQVELENILQTVILPNTSYKIDHRWAGIMGVGETKKVITKRISDNVTCAVRLGGMGVAIGTSVGKRSAEMIG